MKVDLLAIGVHPDDIELSCAGTLLAHAELGYSFGLVDLTRGELGSRGSAEIRTREAYAAAEKLGARFRENLDLPDGFLYHTEANVRRIIASIRSCQPEIVLANALGDRHPDHGRAARLVADACYYSGLVKIETHDENDELQQQWRPRAVYHYVQDRNRAPDFVVDITRHFNRKMEAIACYTSQFNEETTPEYAGEVSTPISGSGFMEFLRAKARSYGREAGYELAEGFQVGRYPGVKDLFQLD